MFKHVKYIDYMKVSISKIAHSSPHLCPKLIKHHISEENKILALSLTNAPLLHPGHLGVAHSQIWG